jgi:threonine synthase
VALACTFKLRERGVIREDERVVVVSTANALKFTEFKVRYHEHALAGVATPHANPPVELPPDYERVLEALERHSEARAVLR